MIVTVFGATGQVGKQLVKQALAKGHIVRAFGRNVSSLIDEDMRINELQAIQGSVFEEEDVFNAIEGADGVISVLGGGVDGIDKTRSLGMKTIVAQMKKAGITNIVALGNTAVLEDVKGGYILDSPDFPEEFIPVAKEHLQAYLHLKESGLLYTFVCSPQIKDEESSKSYITSINFLPHPNKGIISTGNLADFMITELENRQYVKQRVGISEV